MSDLVIYVISSLDSNEEINMMEKVIHSKNMRDMNFIVIHNYSLEDESEFQKKWELFKSKRNGEEHHKGKVEVYLETKMNTITHIPIKKSSIKDQHNQNVFQYLITWFEHFQSKKSYKRNDEFLIELRTHIYKMLSNYLWF